MVEIERKWRLRRYPTQFNNLPKKLIRQGYLVTAPGEMRLRQMENDYFLTVKSEPGIKREEWERKIPKWVFYSLWNNIQGQAILKERSKISYGKYSLEIDTYLDYLTGLIVLECEFPNLEEAGTFSLPSELLDSVEITGDIHYSNQYLAIHGFTQELIG